MKNKHDENVIIFAWKREWGKISNGEEVGVIFFEGNTQSKNFFWVRKADKIIVAKEFQEKNFKYVICVANKKVKFQAAQGDSENER